MLFLLTDCSELFVGYNAESFAMSKILYNGPLSKRQICIPET